MGARVANASLSGPGPSRTIDDAIRSLPNTLYVVPAGNDGSDTLGDQRTPCVPAELPDAPNKLCVAATDQNDQLAATSNYGTVHVDLSARRVDPEHAADEGDFLGGFREWDGRALDQRRSRASRLQAMGADEPRRSKSFAEHHRLRPAPSPERRFPYDDNQDNWARTVRGINLTGGRDCEYGMKTYFDTEYGHDPFTVEASRTPFAPGSWQPLTSYWGLDGFSVSAPFPAEFNGQRGVFLRLRMRSDAAVHDDGAYVDDINVTCFGLYNASSYGFRSGTSTAAPQVSGAAGFLFTKFPAASVADVEDKILRSVDKLASLDGRVLTGGRLNLYKAAAESTAAVSQGILTFAAGIGETNNVSATGFLDGNVQTNRISIPLRRTGRAGRRDHGSFRAWDARASTTTPLSVRQRASAGSWRTVAISTTRLTRAGSQSRSR